MIYIGIDFGTTNSCIYIANNENEDPTSIVKNDDGSPLIIPSVICEIEEGSEIKRYYGSETLEKVDKNVKLFANLKLSLREKANRGNFTSNNGWQYYHKGRPLRGPKYSKKALTEDFIKYLFNKSGIEFGRDKSSITWNKGRESAAVARVKITMGHPVFKQDEQQRAYLTFFKDILKRIGFEEENILFSAESCLAAYGLARGADNNLSVGDRILIFDCGGGTTDVSILEKQKDNSYSEIDSAGCNYAGVAIDKALYRYMRKNSRKDYSRSFIDNVFDGKTDINISYLTSITKLKEEYCINPNENIDIKALKYAKELGISDCHDFIFDDFYMSEFWKDIIQKILRPLNDVIERANPASTGHTIKKIYLTGGSSAMPKIKEEITAILNKNK